MQNPDHQQNPKLVSLTAGPPARKFTSGLLGLIRGSANDIAVRIAIWADDSGNHEESLSMRSTLPVLAAQEPLDR